MTQPIDVGRLRLLQEVAVRGSIAGAARSVGLTPSAVSQQLAVLEREAGVALFDRSSRGVALTGAGQMLCERAGEVLDLLIAARADLDALGGELGGPVRVATVASAALGILSGAGAALGRQYPTLQLHVSTAEPGQSMQRLLDGDVDLGVLDEYDYQPIALAESLQARELRIEALVAVLPTGFADGPVDLTDLADADWVMPPDDAACGYAVRSACRAAGFEPRVRWETDDMLLLTRAVAAGHGVAVLPALSVDTTASGVTVADLRRPRLTRRLFLVGRTVNLRRPVVEAVARAIQAAAAVPVD